jgi:tRNA(fMet)-specific endonuclease VapC
MIKAMLDTNILIYITNRHPPEVFERLRKFRQGEIVISGIVWAEFAVGLYKRGMGNSPVDPSIEVIPFDQAAGNVFGKLTVKYPDRVKAFDRMIAAHAISVGAKLITNNTADFALYLDDGLAVENWV